MSCGNFGCCCGMVIGFVLAVVLAIAAAFGIYCYFNPEACDQSRNAIVTTWDGIKDGGDQLVVKVGGSMPQPEPRILEPEVSR